MHGWKSYVVIRITFHMCIIFITRDACETVCITKIGMSAYSTNRKLKHLFWMSDSAWVPAV